VSDAGKARRAAVTRSPHEEDEERGVPTGPLLPFAELVRAAPSLAKVAAVCALHITAWSAAAVVAGANYVAKRAIEGQPASAILQDATNDLRDAAWRALGLRNQDGAAVPVDRPANDSSTAELQRRGAELMRRSSDVRVLEDAHPAFARILSEITPDEARILRFLYLEGAQPALDVRTNRPFGIGSVLVASGLSMVAERAGCRYLDRIDQYIVNLTRLGLVEFSKEPVTDPGRYQVLEAQPMVTEALKAAGRFAKLVQRSILLTSFGREFCRTCLPLTPPVQPKPISEGHPRPVL